MEKLVVGTDCHGQTSQVSFLPFSRFIEVKLLHSNVIKYCSMIYLVLVRCDQDTEFYSKLFCFHNSVAEHIRISTAICIELNFSQTCRRSSALTPSAPHKIILFYKNLFCLYGQLDLKITSSGEKNW